MSIATHEEHFRTVSSDVRERLEHIQAEVQRKAPGAEPCIGYGMPAFRQGRIFFYFAAFKNHIGVYPPVKEPPELLQELAPYRGPKGNLSFPHKQPLPIDLIGRVAKALLASYAK